MKKFLVLLLALTMVCSLCACADEEMTEEQAAALSMWADDLYEPATSISYPATIVWPADKNAQEVADLDVRPNTMIVSVDKKLKVHTLDGKKISNNLGIFLSEVKDTTLVGLYLKDDAAANAVGEFIAAYAVADVFVVADHEHTQYVKDICDANSGVLGIVDWTNASLTTSREDLLNIVQTTNASHAKIAIIPENIAEYDAVEYLRGMLLTVWAETSTDAQSVYTQLTNGVNGIYCSDYEAVANAITSVNDEGSTLMRHVYIAGHRGMPGAGYIENTVNSGRAAIEVGANVIECDVGLSADGEIFVLHDDTVGRLFNDENDTWAESLTLAELQALEFDMTDDTKENAPNSVLNANNTNRTTKGREDTVIQYDPETDYIPSLREYWESLDDEDVIHFIEIKSYQPEIIEPLKALAEEMGMEDRMCVITFNDGVQYTGDGSTDESQNVVGAMRELWPEMSLGYLGYGMEGIYWGDHAASIEANGIGATVGDLYMNFLQPNNATYNSSYATLNQEVNLAARHRGMTSWNWTYNNEEDFANHYLNGGTYSMTTNFAMWASDWAVKVEAEDAVVSNGDTLNVDVISQIGDVLDVTEGLSLVPVSGVEVALEDGKIVANGTGEAVVMVRYQTELNVNGVDLSIDPTYSIYSSPITLTIQ